MAKTWKMPKWFYQLGSPRWFYEISGRLLPWFSAAAIGLLVILIGMHIGAALLHGLILKDGIIARMWPPVQPRERG